MMKQNNLGQERSEYLKQHQDNPIWWNVWSEKILQRAQEENKLIFVSIGYSSCHWCHVMEKESFESQEVADLLNENYISIKIDREERPDLDKYFMNAVMKMGRRGGWPLNLFLTPQGVPIYGGSYFPKNNFMQITASIQKKWQEGPEEILDHSAKFKKFLEEKASLKNEKSFQGWSHEDDLIIWNELKLSFDKDYGGFASAPKFPPVMKNEYLFLKALELDEAKKILEKNLQYMFRGAIYDHLGGGFARYSTDVRWEIPHFEKMLYTNALMLQNYLEAYSLTGEKFYADVAQDIFSYLEREMQDDSGAFYAAQDADTHGKEGEYYVWDYDEIKNLLSEEEFSKFIHYYSIEESGNFESKNALYLNESVDFQRFAFTEDYLQFRKKLLPNRSQRLEPLKDKKVILSWNAYLLSSYILAAEVFLDDRYLAQAEKLADFLFNKFWNGEFLHRSYQDGEAFHTATLDDYAALMASMIRLYQNNFEEKWIQRSIELLELLNRDYWREKDSGYAYQKKLKDLDYSEVDFFDNARPNANAIMLKNLMNLYSFTLNSEYQEKIEMISQKAYAYFSVAPQAVMSFVTIFKKEAQVKKQIIVVGKDSSSELMKELKKLKLSVDFDLFWSDRPEDSLLSHFKAKESGDEKAYLCSDGRCSLETKCFEELLKNL